MRLTSGELAALGSVGNTGVFAHFDVNNTIVFIDAVNVKGLHRAIAHKQGYQDFGIVGIGSKQIAKLTKRHRHILVDENTRAIWILSISIAYSFIMQVFLIEKSKFHTQIEVYIEICYILGRINVELENFGALGDFGLKANLDVKAETPREADGSMPQENVVCLECGKALQLLSHRHLATHGLTPRAYKRKHGLHATQTLCTPALARRREALAQNLRTNDCG